MLCMQEHVQKRFTTIDNMFWMRMCAWVCFFATDAYIGFWVARDSTIHDCDELVPYWVLDKSNDNKLGKVFLSRWCQRWVTLISQTPTNYSQCIKQQDSFGCCSKTRFWSFAILFTPVARAGGGSYPCISAYNLPCTRTSKVERECYMKWQFPSCLTIPLGRTNGTRFHVWAFKQQKTTKPADRPASQTNVEPTPVDREPQFHAA
jgi:hypothetical protein